MTAAVWFGWAVPNGKDCDVGEIESVAAGWLIASVALGDPPGPATVIVADSGPLPEFAATEYVTMPFPDPDAPAVIVTADELLVAAQLLRLEVTETVRPDWPATPTDCVVGFNEMDADAAA